MCGVEVDDLAGGVVGEEGGEIDREGAAVRGGDGEGAADTEEVPIRAGEAGGVVDLPFEGAAGVEGGGAGAERAGGGAG